MYVEISKIKSGGWCGGRVIHRLGAYNTARIPTGVLGIKMQENLQNILQKIFEKIFK